ncbi:MAG: hypothetical protein H0W78_08365 [Planctomycetes bacterium]|nr:hypothetical protein [Planctomycetota bacterium]
MTTARRASLSACLPLVGALAALIAGEAPPLTGTSKTPPRIEAPNLEFDTDGSVIAPRGFVAHMGDKVLLGDALRYHQKHDDLYATGKVVLVLPGVRLHAERLGLHPQAESGEGWEVEAFIEHAGRRITIRAAHVHIDRTVLRFDGVRGIAGHGGVMSVSATSARVYLRDKPAEDRDGFERQVEGIELISPTIRAAGIPVFWLPYLYRDFYFDYPWTRYEGGKTRRMGYYVRAWLGTSLPEAFGWHSRIQARGDLYSQNGEGWGVRAAWRNANYGKGEVSWFEVPHEIVKGGPDDLQSIVTRRAAVFDAEQQLHAFGGALYARWVELPDADPPFGADPAEPWDERFRADYLRDDLEHRPFARRGVTATWGSSLGTVTLDTERRAHPDQPLTDRLWGVQVQVPRIQVAGPLHVGGSGWSESLENHLSDDAAVRTSFAGTASAMKWFGPLGVDLGGGVNGLAYQDAQLGGVEVDDELRMVPLATAGMRMRFVGDWGDGLSHVFTPRIGVELYQEGEGDVLSPWVFGDPRDRLDEDVHLFTTGFDTSIAGKHAQWRASAVARWAMRKRDRFYDDVVLGEQEADSALYDVVASLEGQPIATLRLSGSLSYDAQREDWRSFDVGTSWVTTRWMAVRYTGTLIPDTLTDEHHWQHRPGLTMIANRYRFDGDVTFRPGGDVVDQWLAQLTRRMVDGDLTLTYELVRAEDGHIYDRRFGVGFTMTIGGAPGADPGVGGR